ncbi:hypothetical protein J2X11_001383 [Aeromicrobium panaciterrae]|uniref:Uncharacterized protein n=1 Tax=Aeromicrobium panaciterrae TaxID=363861 RepID=A0ABU1UMY7_9ACTN|nr:hypothetical protein [Aeromicrobium panaciterrae]MDR7086544.1 hypothetical protein [Aeromicrobium panaciterrae]
MPAWLSRLLDSPRDLAIAGASLVAVAAVVTALFVLPADSNGGGKPSAESPSAGSSSAAPSAEASPSSLPPDKDKYCPAFRQMQKGGLADSGDKEEEGVDTSELSKLFDQLLSRYSKAERVAPLSLRDDYAKALGFLREGKKAADSNDPELLKALAVNLETLNASMDAIQTKSAKFCR